MDAREIGTVPIILKHWSSLQFHEISSEML